MISHVPADISEKMTTIMSYLRPAQKSKRKPEPKKSGTYMAPSPTYTLCFFEVNMFILTCSFY